MSDQGQGGDKPDGFGGLRALGHDAVLDLTGVCERVFHALWLAVLVFDRRLNIVLRNQPADMLFDDTRQVDEALRQATVEGRYRDWASELREVMESRRQRQFGGVTFRNDQAADRLLDLVCAPLTDPGSQEVVGGMLVAEDVTARMSMERRLAVSERLAAVGKHSAKVAHELNNPLDGILRYINLAMRVAKQSGQGQIADYLERSRGGLMRVVEITGELLEFSRSTYANLEESSINEIVDEAVKAMEDKAVAQGVTTVCDYHEQMPRLRGSGNVFQVFCNLIKNAVDAMPDGGKLLISTRVAGRDAVVTFEDTGVGLPEEIDRVFEPFFSTKGPGKGTGLGLAICRDILEKYNGRITASRRGGGGSIFTVRIPLESCSQEASR